MTSLTFQPVTPDTLQDFMTVMGPRGGTGGCWCMYWRRTKQEFEAGTEGENKDAMSAVVQSGRVPGIVGYVDGEPAGWIAVAPREDFPRLEKSRVLRPVDDQPVWSVTCFYVQKQFRKTGLSVHLLRAAVDYAGQQGAQIVEGYPVSPTKKGYADAFVWTGLATVFLKAGFEEVERRSETRPIMRYMIN